MEFMAVVIVALMLFQILATVAKIVFRIPLINPDTAFHILLTAA
jgi:hypothetical protein